MRPQSGRELETTRKALRELSGRLLASLWAIPFYNLLARLGRVPDKDAVLKAADQLVGWSNGLYGTGGERGKCRRIIVDRLGISKKIGEIG